MYVSVACVYYVSQPGQTFIKNAWTRPSPTLFGKKDSLCWQTTRNWCFWPSNVWKINWKLFVGMLPHFSHCSQTNVVFTNTKTLFNQKKRRQIDENRYGNECRAFSLLILSLYLGSNKHKHEKYGSFSLCHTSATSHRPNASVCDSPHTLLSISFRNEIEIKSRCVEWCFFSAGQFIWLKCAQLRALQLLCWGWN